MTGRAMRAVLTWGLVLAVWPMAARAQVDADNGDAVVVDMPEPDRGCPAKPEFMPMTPMALVGIERLGWLVHQAIIPSGKDKFFQAGARSRSGVKPVPAEMARKLGAPDTKVPLWVFGKENSKACKATPTAWWAVRMGTDEDRQTYLMAEVAVECELLPPGRLSGTPIAVRQKDEPTGCRLRRPNRSQTGKDSDGLPPDYAEHIPPQDCAAPECARLWEYFGVTGGEDSAGAFDLTVSYLHRNGSNPCNWATDDLSKLFVRHAESTSLQELKPGGVLFGGLWDFNGLRYILSRQMGVFYAYDYQQLKAPRPKMTPKSVRYGSPTEEDLIHAKRSLSPCKK
ncbi:hypothetical protein [Corallococcus terminator]|uniref:DUF1176 domain-containing protein n=1 Tax=Corallococcus terminator TaxID=2316733 RepID=A0A3A8JPP0_9BACT|nr:hypothetical protein [Corallococcus terminator]RKG91603.1 hypothetical protein D7V88_09170 [Corallococcus terminator]